MRRFMARVAKEHSKGMLGKYIESQQAVTNGGTFTITHNFGTRPKIIQTSLKFLAASGGYAIGDELLWGTIDRNSNPGGVALVFTTTTIIGRYASSTTPFLGIHFATGNTVAFTPTDADLIIRAWA